MLTDLILGTAGHIDHGKTSLIGALTGILTDRLPEEKKRGITIELGYAHLELPPFRLGIVDVPGHEKFVRQMLAGATGMDLAMLVVAGDDSIKQQTREHLDILRMLNLPSGVIALTKCDLVEEDWLELVEDEIRTLVQGTFLENARIIRTSAKTKEGLDELKQALIEAAEVAATSNRAQRLQAPFRMAIDRVFTIEGHGTVVTGSVNSGSLNVGDQIEIQPGDHNVRVRGLQNHDSSTEEVHRGQRAAINVAGIHHNDIERGHELCANGHLVPSRMMTVSLNVLSNEHRPVKDRQRVRFHVGTAELFGNVRILGQDEILPGESGYAQIYLNEPAVAIWNQPFVVRRQSPVETVGGGRILHPNACRLRKPTELDLEMVRQMGSDETIKRASAACYLSDEPDLKSEALSRTAGIVESEQAFEQLKGQGELIEIRLSVSRTALVHKQRFEQIADRVVKRLGKMHDAEPLRFSHLRRTVEAAFAYLEQPELLAVVISELAARKTITIKNDAIGLVGRGPKLSKGEQAILGELISLVKSQGFTPDTAADLQKSARKNKDSVPQLLSLAAENGDLIKVDKDYYFHVDVINDAKEKIAAAVQSAGGQSVSDIRKLLDVSRKYAVPICEYLDSIEFTRREGDTRVLC
ncbi:MAG: selenocysteine-specific translation elongation factor [Planctomycetota bacterium]